MKYHFYGLVLVATLGCAAPGGQPTTFNVQAPFDAGEANRMTSDGGNVIKGNAFMRQRGGGVVTCAGQTVHLVPATAYAKERFTALFGSSEKGINNRRDFKFAPDPPEYYALARKTTCDAQGNFVFDRVADGDFFLTVLVAWEAGRLAQGGHLMQRITVRGGQTQSIVIST